MGGTRRRERKTQVEGSKSRLCVALDERTAACVSATNTHSLSQCDRNVILMARLVKQQALYTRHHVFFWEQPENGAVLKKPASALIQVLYYLQENDVAVGASLDYKLKKQTPPDATFEEQGPEEEFRL